MCTAINQTQGYHLFGRTLDIHASYGEQVVLTPRNYPLPYAHLPTPDHALAMLGVAHVAHDFPLYYDAVNEAGLGMAALRFQDHAVYHTPKEGKQNLASFELMPYLLSQCQTMEDALQHLTHINITNHAFSSALPTTPLHWMLSDAHTSVVVESTQEGLQVYPNPTHVLTNAPPFPVQMAGHYTRHLTFEMTSESRFDRGVFINTHTLPETQPDQAVERFFHVMATVALPKGCHRTPDGHPHYTVYTACGDPKTMTYHTTTYQDSAIRHHIATPEMCQGHRLFYFDLT